MKKLSIIICCLCFGILNAQDPHFSQFNATALDLNPALTGLIDGQYRIQTSYRDQWRAAGSAFKTIYASLDYRHPMFDQDDITFGVKVLRDQAGDSGFTQTSAHLSSSYIKHLFGQQTKHFLIAGFQLGLAQNSMEWGSLWFGNQFDFATLSENLNLSSGETEVLSNTGQTELYFDLGGGIAWFGSWDERKSLTFGMALSHLNQPAVSFLNDDRVELFRKFTFHANAELPLNDALSLMPGLKYSFQGPHSQMVLGSSLRFNQEDKKDIALQLGTWLRVSDSDYSDFLIDALILSIAYEYDRFRLGLSYDITLSDFSLANNRRGAFELNLSYVFPPGERRRALRCPNM